MYDHPRLNSELMKDARFDKYLFTCQWLLDVFSPFYGNKCALWHAGIETDEWKDTKKLHKDIDVLIYNKLRWTENIKRRFLLEPIKKIWTIKILIIIFWITEISLMNSMWIC